MSNANPQNVRQPENADQTRDRIPEDETLQTPKETRRVEVASVDRASLVVADESLDEATRLDEQDLDAKPEESPEVIAIWQTALVSALAKLVKENPDALEDINNIDDLSIAINKHKDVLNLTTAEIVAIARLQESGKFMEAVKNNWANIVEDVREAKKIADDLKAAEANKEPWYKTLPKWYAKQWQDNPVMTAVAHVGLIGAGLAIWKIGKWAWKNRKAKTTKWALGGGILATVVGLLTGPKMVSSIFEKITGIKMEWKEMKNLAKAIMSGNIDEATRILNEAKDERIQEHKKYVKFIKKHSEKSVNVSALKFAGPQDYNEFISGSFFDDLAENAGSLAQQLNSGNATALLALSDAKNRLELTTLRKFFEKEVIKSEDFKGKTVDEVLAIIVANPQKYLTKYAGKEPSSSDEEVSSQVPLGVATTAAADAEAGTKAPETFAEMTTQGAETAFEDFGRIFADLKAKIINLPHGDGKLSGKAVVQKYEKQFDELGQEKASLGPLPDFEWDDWDSWEPSKRLSAMKLYSKEKALKLEAVISMLNVMKNNSMAVAVDGTEVIIGSAAGIVYRSTSELLGNAFKVVFSDMKAKEAGYAYIASASGLIIIGATAGAVKGFIGKSGMILGAAVGAAKGAVFPIYAAGKVIEKGTNAYYHWKHLDEYAEIIKNEFAYWKNFAKKRWEKLIEFSSVERQGIELEYRTKQAELTWRKWKYWQRLQEGKNLQIPGFETYDLKQRIKSLKDKYTDWVGLKANEAELGTLILQRTKFEVPKIERYGEAILVNSAGKLKGIIRTMAENPHSVFAEKMLRSSKLVLALLENDDLLERLSDVSAVEIFNNKNFIKKLDEILESTDDAKKIATKIHKEVVGIKTSSIEITRLRGLDINKIIEEKSPAKIQSIINKLSEEIVRLPAGEIRNILIKQRHALEAFIDKDWHTVSEVGELAEEPAQKVTRLTERAAEIEGRAVGVGERVKTEIKKIQDLAKREGKSLTHPEIEARFFKLDEQIEAYTKARAKALNELSAEYKKLPRKWRTSSLKAQLKLAYMTPKETFVTRLKRVGKGRLAIGAVVTSAMFAIERFTEEDPEVSWYQTLEELGPDCAQVMVDILPFVGTGSLLWGAISGEETITDKEMDVSQRLINAAFGAASLAADILTVVGTVGTVGIGGVGGVAVGSTAMTGRLAIISAKGGRFGQAATRILEAWPRIVAMIDRMGMRKFAESTAKFIKGERIIKTAKKIETGASVAGLGMVVGSIGYTFMGGNEIDIPDDIDLNADNSS